ncbi:uncharacterized protein LOC129908495 [Episyrphus balteatus]|uniref:uncharacterized protein LOC129908495 n=1 Tax=Episyrphus balteatus TaxID=286459 RepID=UPI0024868C89|nr:uncharacterized protein LOC129908495 [Episyrphus balteatus]
MEEMQVFTIVARQKAITEEVQRLKTNISKDGSDRKTAEYKTKKLRALEELWVEFATNHEKIKAYVKADTPYVQANTYEKVKNAYMELKRTIESIEPSDAKSDPVKTVVEQATKTSTPVDSEIDPPKKSNGSNKNPTERQEEFSRIIRRHNTSAQSLQRLLDSIQTTQEEWSTTFCSVKISLLQKYWAKLEETHLLVHEFVNDPKRAGYKLEDFYKFEDDVQQCLISLTARLEQSSALPSSPNIPVVSEHKPTLKLPKITLPKFDGNYIKWKQFCDLFTELVYKQDIANCQKLFYLKTTLTGEAENLIRHFSTSDNNYDAAWQVVKDRYDNPRLLVTAHVQKLLMQPAIQAETAKAVKGLHDTTQECMLSLKGLNIDTNNWDPLLMTILIKKLDRNTLTLWEQSLKQPKALPSLHEFLTFLEQRFQSLEAMGPKVVRTSSDDLIKRTRVSLASTDRTNNCSICEQKRHAIPVCPKFLQQSTQERLTTVKSLKCCINCLRFGHQSPKCKSMHCTKCNKYHHTLLHVAIENQRQKHPAIHNRASTSAASSSTADAEHCTSAAGTTPTIKQQKAVSVILGTAIVHIMDQSGQKIECRALLDSGSQVNFITDKLARALGLKETYETLCVEGIGQGKQASNRRINLKVDSTINRFSARMEAHVLPKIISTQPSMPINTTNWNIPNNIVLADSQFNRPGTIDLLIGAEIFYSTLVVGQISLGDNLPTLQNTVFGWIVSGKVSPSTYTSMVASCGISVEDAALYQQIERFWRLEEVTSITHNLTQAERRCENHFLQTTTRDSNSRFVVRLPFKEAPTCLGESKDIARQRFYALERRLAKDPELKLSYRQFMKEYQELGHMSEVNIREINEPYYFMPHLCVQKPDSSTTKLRVVFDASAKTSANLSLNDILHTGPTIQDDVFTMLLRFRIPRYVFTADIEKMYRQVLINEEDQKYQLIWWRFNSNDPLKCFKLHTVTYGTSSASYLATKCLQALAHENKQRFPLGSAALARDFYVDDVLTGSDKITELLATQSELQTILSSGGFKLRKWCANHASLLNGIPLEDRETELDFSDNIDEQIKTVGLTWMPKSDQLCVKTTWAHKTRTTKRIASSDIAHLFDPLGIMGPVVVIAKNVSAKNMGTWA